MPSRFGSPTPYASPVARKTSVRITRPNRAIASGASSAADIFSPSIPGWDSPMYTPRSFRICRSSRACMCTIRNRSCLSRTAWQSRRTFTRKWAARAPALPNNATFAGRSSPHAEIRCPESHRRNEPHPRGRIGGRRALYPLFVPRLRIRPHSDRFLVARAGERIAPARASGRRMDHDAGRLSVSGDRAVARLAPARHRGDAARIVGIRRRGAESVSGTAGARPGPLRRAGRIRAADDPCRGAARRGRAKEPSVASQGGALAVHDLLPAWPLLSAFLVASLILAVTPGPAVVYIVTRSVAQGRRCGLAS